MRRDIVCAPINRISFCRHFLILDNATISIFTYSGRLHLTPKYSGLSAQLNILNEKYISLGLHFIAVRDCGEESRECLKLIYFAFECKHFSFLQVIHVFDLMPGATRQTEAIPYQTKSAVQQIAVSRAGNLSDQYLVFIDVNRDIFCTSLKSDGSPEIYKIGK